MVSLLLAKNPRPKIGLALSGGGALGFAHIGILEKIDSLNIPVDYISGTSMGGLVGALYASGYSSDELLEIVLTTDWLSLFNDNPPRSQLPYFEKVDVHKYQFNIGISEANKPEKMGLIEGQAIELFINNLVNHVSVEKNFDKLPIPFRCISVDILSGNEVVMSHGSLAKAMRATMSVPTIFSPVEYGDSLLIDGGIINNMPVDVARKMGADHVLAVSVRNPNKKKEELGGFLDILMQSYNIIGQKQIHKQAEQADTYIPCLLENLTPMDFSSKKVLEIINVGRHYANKHLDKLVAIKEMLSQYEQISDNSGYIKIDTVSIQENIAYKDEYIQNLMALPTDEISADQIVERLDFIKDTLDLKEINYKILQTFDMQNHLVVRINERTPKIFGVYIHGNKINSFGFIYRLLGIKPGTKLDIDLLERRINYLYSLGYFKKITYDLDFAIPGYIKLNINVSENPRRKIRFGLHYDNHYNIVAAISGQFNNFLIPGLRLEDEFQILGYTDLSAKIYYPSRTLDIPVYPFVELNYQNKPYILWDHLGNKQAKFNHISYNTSAGLGLLYKNIGHLSTYLNHAYVEAEPDILTRYEEEFDQFRDKITSMNIDYNLDLLDDYLVPKQGVYIEGSIENAADYLLATDRKYFRYKTSVDLYFTMRDILTLHLNGFYCYSENAPEYKHFWVGGPNSFIGVDYNQLLVKKMTYLKPEIDIEIIPNLRWSLIYNYAFNYKPFVFTQAAQLNESISAWGSGFEYKTPAGPIKLIMARSIQSTSEELNNKFHFYLTAGYNF